MCFVGLRNKSGWQDNNGSDAFSWGYANDTKYPLQSNPVLPTVSSSLLYLRVSESLTCVTVDLGSDCTWTGLFWTLCRLHRLILYPVGNLLWRRTTHLISGLCNSFSFSSSPTIMFGKKDDSFLYKTLSFHISPPVMKIIYKGYTNIVIINLKLYESLKIAYYNMFQKLTYVIGKNSIIIENLQATKFLHWF